eukprot:TRINITY_DN1779_c0_g2_i1.p1 TRINITY_DN1779_c0_g2~~TRINITY_DN1779_c0_g2_i1.p1  ORF type:complete len:103 (+),score=11.57 TRINITY_DN1779_c0_g2_i1:742-1050(+)
MLYALLIEMRDANSVALFFSPCLDPNYLILNVVYFIGASSNGHDVKLFDMAKSVHWVVDGSSGENGRKRRKGVRGDESDEEDESGSAPVNDIYRMRQQKRMK